MIVRQDVFPSRGRTNGSRLHFNKSKARRVQNNRIIRRVLIGVGGIGILVFLLGYPHSVLLLLAAVLSIFLGVTNFGRECPLILSIRHLVFRIKARRQSPPL
jgi:hypothetical protein